MSNEEKFQFPMPETMFQLAMRANLPLLHCHTDDVLYVEEVLSFLSCRQTPSPEPSNQNYVRPLNLPEVVDNPQQLPIKAGYKYYTSSECPNPVKLYKYCEAHDITIVFVNTKPNPLLFDGGELIPCKQHVFEHLVSTTGAESDDEKSMVAELMGCVGGLHLKDITEVAKLCFTRDEKLSQRGINSIRRGLISKLQGITQIDTEQGVYIAPSYLTDWLNNKAQFFIKPVHPSLTPRGLLFGGKPGTGKTAGAKYVASSLGVPLYHLDLGGMMDKYVGNSEANIRAALAQIDAVEPCVVLMDEVEKMGFKGGDSGVSSRMLATLLWWLQEHKSRVFTVMTTNDENAIPPELHRDGRIDGSMSFNGIETFIEAFEFCCAIAEGLCTDIGIELSSDLKNRLQKLTKPLFVGGESVPQVSLVKLAVDTVSEHYLHLQTAVAGDDQQPVQTTEEV